MSEYLTPEIAEQKRTITETVTVETGDGAEEYKVDYYEATLEEAAELEAREQSGEAEEALMQEAINEYVAKPDLEAGNLPMSTLQAIMRGMYRAWGLGEDDIDEMLNDRSGN